MQAEATAKPELPPWEEVRRISSGTLSQPNKIIVTAKSGTRVSTVEFLNEHHAAAFNWEEDFQFALRKAVSNPRKGFRT